MKKYFLSILTILLTVFLLFPVSANAVDISVGASTWYAWWELEMEGGTIELDPVFLYGPLLSIRFAKNWSISTIFVYGKYHTDKKDQEGEDSGGMPEELTRYDSDTALNYNINRYFKVFMGFKFMGFKYDGGSHEAMGPGFGIGLTLPLFNNFYLLANISGMYMKGSDEHESETGTSKNDFVETGFNTNVSLAYYIDPVTITLGGRYQYFEAEFDDKQEDYDPDFKSYFYGITLSAIYSFIL